jgi:hypothetical protein
LRGGGLELGGHGAAVFAWMAANAPGSFGSGAPIKAMLEARQGR